MSSIRTITSPLEIALESKQVSFDTIVFKQNGCLVVRGDCSIQIAEVINEKPPSSSVKYEFLIQPPTLPEADPGEDGSSYTEPITVSIAVEKLNNTISVKALGGNGGDGGCSIAGGSGGAGADGYFGGCGGGGGIGGNGGNGGSGGPPPEVQIAFSAASPAKGSSKHTPAIVVLSADDKVCDMSTPFDGSGGLGGQPGKGGEGGQGGKGGKNLSDGTYATNGLSGKAGAPGAPGQDYRRPEQLSPKAPATAE